MVTKRTVWWGVQTKDGSLICSTPCYSEPMLWPTKREAMESKRWCKEQDISPTKVVKVRLEISHG